MTRSLKYRLGTTGGNIDALLDSGAELSMISAETVRRRAIPTEPLEEPLDVVCADCSRVRVTRCVPSLPLTYNNWTDNLHCVVVPNLSNALLLGRDWLARWNPMIDWVTGELTLANGGEPWLPRGDTHDSPHLSTSVGVGIEEMTPSAFRKWWRVLKRHSQKESPPPCLVFAQPLQLPPPDSVSSMLSTTAEDPLPLQIHQLMKESPRVFEEATGVEPDPPVRYPIRLQEGAQPSHVKPYRFSESQKNEMREQVSVLLQKGWIRPSSSPWGAPVLLVPKKDGTWRFCVDFRNLNAVTVRDSFPLPRIDDLLHKVGQAGMFSKMDMQSGFHQVPMEEDSIETTAFTLPETVQGSAHFEWIVMPFGLMNAPSTFQRLVSKVLVGCEAFTAAYIDDILIFSKDEAEHEQHLRQVLECLVRRNLRVKLKKCCFFRQQVPFLGHILAKGCVRVEPEKIEAL